MTRYAITRALAWSFAILALAGMAVAQQQTQIERGEVVYVSGNDFVVKMENGEVRHFTAPPGATAVVDGKTITVADLKPGMKLQRTTTTTTVNRTVRNVRTVQGTVWQVNAPYVIFTGADGKNKQVKVPDGTKFTIGGEKKTVFDLKKGMKFTATVVTESPETVVSQQRSVTGAGAPPPPAPIAYIPPPAPEAPLVIEEPAPAKPVAQAEAAPAPAPEPAKLPKTGTPLPLIGLLGFGMSAAGIAMRLFRR